MSNSVDQRIVQMQFDNSQFEKGVSTTLDSLKNLDKSLELKDGVQGLKNVDNAMTSLNFSSVQSGVENLSSRFGSLGEIASNALINISARMADLGENILRGVTIQPMLDGLEEYSTKLDSVQTILTNTEWEGRGDDNLQAVIDSIDELNLYADKTIYNFSQMTRNIGTFTAAGVGLEDATTAIQGIANLAASSGSNAQQASMAMYQMSQALSSGTVRLQDWISVVNSGMGGKLFQDALKTTSDVMAQQGKTAVSATDAIKEYGNFRDSLTKGEWLTSDVLLNTLRNFTLFEDNMSAAEEKQAKAMLANEGYTEAQIDEIQRLSQNAYVAATKVKSFEQLIDTTKEALGSGWGQTWEYIIGDLQQARDLFTPISDTLSAAIGDFDNARNSILKEWSKGNEEKGWESGRDAMVRGLQNLGEVLIGAVMPVRKALDNVFGDINAKGLIDLSTSFESLTIKFKDFVENSPAIQTAAKGLEIVFTTLFKAIRLAMSVFGGVLLVAVAAVGLAFQAVGFIVSTVTDIICDGFGIVAEYVVGAGKAVADFGKTIADRLRIDSFVSMFQNLGNAIESLLSALKGEKSFDDFFGKMAYFKDYSIPNVVRELSDRFSGLTDTLKPVFKLFRDNAPIVFANAIGIIVLGAMKLGELLTPVVEKFKDFVYAIGELFGDSFNLNEIGDTIGRAKDVIVKAISEITDIGDPGQIKKLGQKIRDAFGLVVGEIGDSISDLFGKLKDKFKGSGDAPIAFIGEVFDRISEKIAGAFDVVKAFLGGLFGEKVDFSGLFSFIDSLKNLFKGDNARVVEQSVDVLGRIGDKISNVKNAFSNLDNLPKAIGEGLADFVNGIADGIEAFINRLDVGKIKKFVTLISSFAIDAGIIVSIYNFAKALKGIGKVGEVFEGVGETLEGIGSKFKGGKLKTTAESIKAIAVSIAIIAGAIAVLTYIDHEKMRDAIPVMIGIVAVCALFPLLFGKLSALEGFNFAQLTSIGAGVFTVALSVLAMTFALVLLSKASDNIDGGGILVIIGILGGIVALSKIAERIDMKGIKALAKSMRQISLSLLLMWGTITLFGNMDSGTAARSIASIGALMIFIGIMNKIASSGNALSGNKNMFKKMSNALFAISVLVSVCAIVVKTLGELDLGSLAKGVGALGLIMLFIGAFVLSMSDLANIGNPSSMVAPLLALSAAIVVFALAIGGLAMVSAMGGDLVGATIALAVSIAVLAGACLAIGLASKYMEDGAKGMLILVISITALTVILLALSTIDFPTLVAGLITFAWVLAAAAIAMTVFGVIGKFLGTGLVALSTAFLIFGAALLVISAALLIGVAAMALFTSISGDFVPAFQQFADALIKLFQAEDLVGTLVGFSVALALLGAASLVAGLGLGLLGLVVHNLPGTFTKLATDILNSIMLMSTGLSAMRDTIARGVQGLLGGIGDGVSNYAREALEHGRDVAKNIGDGLRNFDWGGAAKQAVITLGNSLVALLTAVVVELPGLIKDIGSSVLEGIGEVLKDPLTSFGDWLYEVTGVGADRTQLKEEAKQTGVAIAEGASEGADEAAKKTEEGYEKIAEATVEGSDKASAAAEEAKSNLVDKLSNFIPGGSGSGPDVNAILDIIGLNPDNMDLSMEAIKSKLEEVGLEIPDTLAQSMSEATSASDMFSMLTENFDASQLSSAFGDKIGEVDWGGLYQENVETSFAKTVDLSKVLDANGAIDESGLKSKFVHAAESAANAFNSSLKGGIKPDLNSKITEAVNQVKKTAQFQAAGRSDGAAITRGFKSGASGMGNAGKSAAQSAIKGISSKDFYAPAFSKGEDAGQGIADGITEKIPSIRLAASAASKAAIITVKKVFDTGSPSKVMIQYGKYFDEGLIVGINSLRDNVGEAAGDVGTTAISSMATMTSDLTGFFDDIDDNPTITPVLDLADYEAGIRQMQALNVGDQTVSAQWAGRLGAGSSAQNGYYNNNQSNINITLDWKAGTTPNQMVQEMANVLQTKNLMEA